MIHTAIARDITLPSQKEFTKILKSYLVKSNVPAQLIPAITDEVFLNENPSYYTYYPHLFKSAFKVVNVDQINLLTIAGFLYYKAVIVMDSVFDNKSSVCTFENYLLSDICKEESIKILSSLFPAEHSFWKLWNLRKMEYAKAYKIDQQTHEIENYADYEKLADFKCAFGKVAIDALHFLSDNFEMGVLTNLLNSHRDFYVAFQIMDDIMDFKEDLENGQFNIALFELEKRIGREEIEKRAIGDLKKQLYLSRIPDELYEIALEYLRKAKSTVEKYDLSSWKYEIQTLNNTIVRHLLNVKGFIRVFNTRQKLSTTRLKENSSLEESLLKGFGFIAGSQGEQHCWYDYFNDGGTSDVWATAFLLSHSFTKNPFFSQVDILKGIQFLKTHLNQDYIWGYNSKWISDADSTTFAMLCLLKHGSEISKETLGQWYLYQNTDGGFGAYNNTGTVITSLNSTSIDNVEGWVQSHFCVSAAAYFFLCQANIQNKKFKALRTYLLNCLRNKIGQLSYWWTNDIYSLNLLIKGALLIDDKEISNLVEIKLETYLRKIPFKEIDSENYFYLGLTLECISSSTKLFRNYALEASEIVQFLLASQFTDGSWEENYSMRIPHPSIKNPDSKKLIWKKSDYGTNILVSDFQRLFSTSSCLSGLESYQKISKGIDELMTTEI